MRVNVVLRWFAVGTAVCAATVAALVLPSLATQGLSRSANALVVPPVVVETTLQVRVRPSKPKPSRPARSPRKRSASVAAAPPRPAAAPTPVATRPRPKPPARPARHESSAPRVLLGTTAEPPTYAKQQRGKVVDADDEQENEMAESRRKQKSEEKDEDRAGH